MENIIILRTCWNNRKVINNNDNNKNKSQSRPIILKWSIGPNVNIKLKFLEKKCL